MSLFGKIEGADSEVPEFTPFESDLDKEPYYENQYMPCGCSPARIALIGNSGCGKTTVAMNLILRGYLGDIDGKIWLFAKSAFQSSYQPLRNLAEKFPGKARIETTLDDVSLEELDPERRNVIIIDDFGGDKAADSKALRNLFFTARHYGATVLFLTQNLFKGMDSSLRNNCNAFLLFQSAVGHADKQRIAQYFADGVSVEAFQRAMDEATRPKYSFLFIDRGQTDPGLKYRMGFHRGLCIM